MRDKKGESEAAKMAWGLFEKTGHIGYYFLYNNAKDNRKTHLKKEHLYGNSLVVQLDTVLSLLWLMFSPWLGN